MQRIFLVRHGQASFGDENYDQLSALGKQQVALLGQQWARHAINPELSLVGTLQRQQETMQILHQETGNASSIKTLPELNEFPAEAITKHFMPGVVAQSSNPNLSRETIFADQTLFQSLFTHVVKAWISMPCADADKAGFESWVQYLSRAEIGINKIKQFACEAGHEKVLVSTSAGFIGATLALLLADKQQAAEQMFKFAWNIKNSSVTELHLNQDQIFLHGFNDYSHLKHSPDLISYR